MRNSNEIEIEDKLADKMSNESSPTESLTSSTCSSCSPNQIKSDKSNEINMISTGVVRNLRMFFSQTSTLSASPITTSNRKMSYLKKKKSHENLYDLKKSQSVLFEQMNENKKLFQIEKTRSNNYLNEIDSLDRDEEFFGQVNIKARINQFTRRNSLVKEAKNCIKRKNSNSKYFQYNQIERGEYKGSLNYLDKIDDENESKHCNCQTLSLDDSSVATTSSDDHTSLDISLSTSKKDLSLNLSLNENETSDKKETELKDVDKNKFEQNFSSIFSILNELKKENELLEDFLLILQSKIRNTSFELQRNFDEMLNNGITWMDDEINKENIDRMNLSRMSVKRRALKHKF
ncbi:hypothetical protein BpHYR1_026980 [Brachionus plicatilis]|uniref:Uncharacterized protein n=1 Tax=Brachionus plicatilis TaxID=10195 RepID=A0A3M7SPH7_BRAPC|nr:hypothetical protein BpHYR1_026980 [Brachionus plicatilis]